LSLVSLGRVHLLRSASKFPSVHKLRIVSSQHCHRVLKRDLLCQSTGSVLLHAAETWTMFASNIKTLEALHYRASPWQHFTCIKKITATIGQTFTSCGSFSVTLCFYVTVYVSCPTCILCMTRMYCVNPAFLAAISQYCICIVLYISRHPNAIFGHIARLHEEMPDCESSRLTNQSLYHACCRWINQV